VTTVKEVAELADVSASTVSNVFTGHVPVREKTRQKVLKAAEALNYVPNSVASSLRRQGTRLIALSIGDIANPSHSLTVRGASDVFLLHKYHPLIFNSHEDPELERENLDVARRQRVAGLFLAPVAQDLHVYERLNDLGIKIVCVDRRVPGLNADVVRSDDAVGFRRATDHLLDQGHRRVAIIAGPAEITVHQERIRGYQAALMARGLTIEPELIVDGQIKEKSGYEALVRLINLTQPPSGIIATDTRLTLGVLYAMRDYGVVRPEQMALVGSVGRDLQWMSLFTPPLTVVAQPSREMGRKAAELLVARLTGERNGPGEEFLIEPELIVRHPQPAFHLSD
jgi:DNA-binding LacI/PurR family transcriptional regulator